MPKIRIEVQQAAGGDMVVFEAAEHWHRDTAQRLALRRSPRLPQGVDAVTARDELLREMTHNHLYMTDERAEELLDAAIAEALTDPRQHERVAAILRREDLIRHGSPFNRRA